MPCFKDCIFEGVLYVGSAGNGKGTNNIRFENCTFRGPIITNVAESFTAETSKKNVLYFTGDTRFDNTSDFQNVTSLAPNYNVNIGDTHSFDDGTQSTITGLLAGGVVDIRGNANVGRRNHPVDWGPECDIERRGDGDQSGVFG